MVRLADIQRRNNLPRLSLSFPLLLPAMASAILSEELKCPVCLTIYTDPVSLRCGHNFCRVCIDRVLDSQEGSAGYSCPECREKYKVRPTLQKNIALRNIAERFLSTQPDQEEAGVHCTYCVDSPVPAVMSCLLCDASLCDKHLRVHSKAPEHVLCAPTNSPETRKCSVHKRLLEYYCTEDASCVCVSCRLDGEHRGHQVETLQEASEKKKKKMRNDLQRLMAETEEAEKKVQSLEERRRKAQEKADGEAERVTALFRDLRRRLEELEETVLSDITRRVQWYDDVIRQLEIKKEELSRKMRHIEELCNMTDPLTVLQESDTGDLCDTEDRHDKQLHGGGDLDVAGISHTLHTGLADIMSGVTGGISGQPADILLDVNTASNELHISDDRKTASRSDIWQKRPKTPERFQIWPQVLSSRSFSSGQHYWEMDVGGSDIWIVGMCYPSIARGGDQSLIGWNNDWSWCLYRRDNQYAVRHDWKVIQLPDGIPRDRVRIYLDYEAGQISFYALCNRIIRHLHTFITTFTEPLHAGLGVWDGCINISGGSQGGRGVRAPPTGDITGRGL
ncbi:E3 ubiquitin-protein ligase TRIM11-like [Hyperolius riggenbachi]|uniref:E3 ubiquitin-protein ligase TRIM11-like n=1 Tax=Hyperolius riggenbachi TaxID=752182 RepID=UPI0035A2DD99